MNLSNFSGPNAPKIHAGRPSRALLGQSGGGGTKECHFERLPREKLTLLRGLLGHLFVLFVRASRTHKKVSRRAFGNSTVFFSLLGSARRASGGFPSTRELNFHFYSRTQKGSKMGTNMERFGLPNPNYTHFGPPFGRSRGPERIMFLFR